MVGIVLVSHGDMSVGMLEAARMIVGEQEGVATVCLRESDAVEGLMERVDTAIREVDSGEGVLILVDVFGASPFNAGARLAMQRDKTEVISGVNLPMLLELCMQRARQDLSQLVATARSAGTGGIRTLSETLKKAPPA